MLLGTGLADPYDYCINYQDHPFYYTFQDSFCTSRIIRSRKIIIQFSSNYVNRVGFRSYSWHVSSVIKNWLEVRKKFSWNQQCQTNNVKTTLKKSRIITRETIRNHTERTQVCINYHCTHLSETQSNGLRNPRRTTRKRSKPNPHTTIRQLR